MPTTIVAQDGVQIEQNTKIALTGCGEVKGSKVVKPTRAQLLAKALKTCRSRYKHKRSRRLSCEKQARKRYGPMKHAHKAKKARHRG